MGQITLTFAEAENMVAYARTSGVLKREGLSTLTQFRMARLINKLTPELKPLDEKRQELIEKYGEKGEDGKLKVDDRGNATIVDRVAYEQEMTVVLKEELTIEFDALTYVCFEDSKFNGEDFLVFSKVITD